jgi:hypothetical protein
MVWKKEMQDGKVAVLLMNNKNTTADVNVSWSDLPSDMRFRCPSGMHVKTVFANLFPL